tara:strand:+ start:216 stop:569 length:354 start_codon:yes stop_codon:yes gene_type:complete
MIGTKLLSYKLEDGTLIELTNALSGFGRLYLNGKEVSKQRGFGAETHVFNHGGSEFQVSVWPLISMHALGFSIELKKGDERLMLYGKEKGPRPWYIFLAAMMIGAILGMLTVFFLES